MENNNRQGCRWTKASENWEDEILYGKHLRMIETKEPVPYRAVVKSESFGNKWLRCWCSPYDIESIPAEQVEYFSESIEPCATSSENYWKQRCEAAEGVLYFCPLLFLSMSENPRFDKAYEIWKQLKSKQTMKSKDQILKLAGEYAANYEKENGLTTHPKTASFHGYIAGYDDAKLEALKSTPTPILTPCVGEDYKLAPEETELIDVWRQARAAVKNSKFSIADERLEHCKRILGDSSDY